MIIVFEIIFFYLILFFRLDVFSIEISLYQIESSIWNDKFVVSALDNVDDLKIGTITEEQEWEIKQYQF